MKSVVHRIQQVSVAVILFFTVTASHSAYIELVPTQSAVLVGDNVNVFLNVGNIGVGGLSAIHVDMDYDESVLAFQTAVAGDFFSINPVSAWLDFGGFVVEGGILDVSITDPTTIPDKLGIDLLEVFLVPSLNEGQLVVVTFEVVGVGSANLSLNDIFLIDDFGSITSEGRLQGDVIGTSVNVIPSPSVLILFLPTFLGMLVFARNRRTRI